MQTLYATVQGNARDKKNGNACVGKWGEGVGDFLNVHSKCNSGKYVIIKNINKINK